MHCLEPGYQLLQLVFMQENSRLPIPVKLVHINFYWPIPLRGPMFAAIFIESFSFSWLFNLLYGHRPMVFPVWRPAALLDNSLSCPILWPFPTKGHIHCQKIWTDWTFCRIRSLVPSSSAPPPPVCNSGLRYWILPLMAFFMQIH